MTLPRRRSSIAGTKALQKLNGPRTLTAYIRSRSAASVPSRLPTWPIPALLTRMSSPGSRAAREMTAAVSLTSTQASSALPPAALMAATVADPWGSSRSTTQTDAPWAAKQRAMASPMPDPAPVTSAVFPSSLNIGFVCLGCRSDESVDPGGVAVEDGRLLRGREVGEKLPGHAEPGCVGGREFDHRPVAPEEEARGAEGV